MREALRILAGEGLVEITPRHGARVAHVGVRDATELYCLLARCSSRAALAMSKVEAITPVGVAELDAIRAAMEAATADGPHFLSENVAYFRSLAQHCSANALLREFVELDLGQCAALLERVRPSGGLQHVGSLARYAPLHAAVKAGDAVSAPRRPTTRCSSRPATSLVSTLEASSELRGGRRRSDRRHRRRATGEGRPRCAVLATLTRRTWRR